MAYFTPEEIKAARDMDLLTYLKNYDPGNLVKVAGNTYCTREHDSLRISNGKWCWFSQNMGGKSALDYLIKVQGMTFIQAVENIIGHSAARAPIRYESAFKEKKQLLLPERNSNNEAVKRYLQGRGIHAVIIDYCISHDLLYESEKYHNAVFIGYDKDGVPRHGSTRSISTPYKGDVSGSDKHFSFSISAQSDTVHVFESAIDLMSYATLLLYEGQDWRKESLLSLAGVYKTKRNDVVPVALEQFLKDHPEVKTLKLHLDNDEIGRGAVAGIVAGLNGRYLVLDEPPRRGKDVNDYLKIRVGILHVNDPAR